MALLYLKNLIYPSREYRRLAEPGSYDLEDSAHIAAAGNGGSSSNSLAASRSSLDDSHDEKSYASTKDSNNSRFDARLISSFTIGFSDGLTVPFALTAGLSAVGTSRVVIYGGLSELIAGTISMGMGGFLGAKSEYAAYIATHNDTQILARQHPDEASSLVAETLSVCDLPPALLEPTIAFFEQSPAHTAKFLMHFHHHMPETSFSANRAYVNGLVTAGGYVVGGIVPLLPYLFVAKGDVHVAFRYSVATTAFVLFLFGWLKTWVVGERSKLKCARGAVEMFLLGGFAAGAAVGCVKLLKGVS